MTEQEKQKRKIVNYFLTLFIGEEWNGQDFWTFKDFQRLKLWMEDNHPINGVDYPQLWIEYHNKYIRRTYPEKRGEYAKGYRKVLNPSNLFEFLKDKREEWEWVFCFDGCMKCKDERCNYEGKIQHPAAKYLDKGEMK